MGKCLELQGIHQSHERTAVVPPQCDEVCTSDAKLRGHSASGTALQILKSMVSELKKGTDADARSAQAASRSKPSKSTKQKADRADKKQAPSDRASTCTILTTAFPLTQSLTTACTQSLAPHPLIRSLERVHCRIQATTPCLMVCCDSRDRMLGAVDAGIEGCEEMRNNRVAMQHGCFAHLDSELEELLSGLGDVDEDCKAALYARESQAAAALQALACAPTSCRARMLSCAFTS